MKVGSRSVAIACGLCCIALPFNGLAQNTDSLWRASNDAGLPDSSRFQALGKLAWAHMFTDTDSSLSLALLMYERAGEKEDRKHQAMALTYQGIAYNVMGNHFAANESYTQMLDLYQQLGDRRGMAGAFNNLGALYHDQGDPLSAIGWYGKSIAVFEELGDDKGRAAAYNNISGIYNELGDTARAFDYAYKCLALHEASGDKRSAANTLGNIGLIHLEKGSPELALRVLKRSLELKAASGDGASEAKAFHDIGEVYRRMGKLDSAFQWLNNALTGQVALKDESGQASTYASIGFVDLDRQDPKAAAAACGKALAIARDLRLRSIERNACDCLYKAAKALGDDRSALVSFERFTALTDSLHAEDVRRGLDRIEFNRSVMADSLRRAEAKALADAPKGGGHRTAWFIGGGLVVAIAAFAANRRRKSGPASR